MADPDKARKSVPITDEDIVELERWCRKLRGMKEAQLTKILLHYGIKHAPEAIAEMMNEPD